jgi:hypothetical protein
VVHIIADDRSLRSPTASGDAAITIVHLSDPHPPVAYNALTLTLLVVLPIEVVDG